MSEEKEIELEATKDISEKMSYIQKVCEETEGASCFLVATMPTKDEEVGQRIGATYAKGATRQNIAILAHSFLDRVFDKRADGEEKLDPHEEAVLGAILPAILLERLQGFAED